MNGVMAETCQVEDSPELPFLAFPAKEASKRVTGATEDLFRSYATLLLQILGEVSDSRNKDEFEAARKKLMERYMRVMLSLGQLITAEVPQHTIKQLKYEALFEMEADFREYGRFALGESLTEQAIFTIWTLRQINECAVLLQVAGSAPEHRQVEDNQAARAFVGHVLYARFHLDYLQIVLRQPGTIYPEVRDSVAEGLRALVNAYAYIRSALSLRNPDEGEPLIDQELDEEDAMLLADSMRQPVIEV